jgi:hypothetical protein
MQSKAIVLSASLLLTGCCCLGPNSSTRQTNQTPIAKDSTGTTDSSDTGAQSTPEAAQDAWVDASQDAVEQDAIRVTVREVAVRKVELNDILDKSESQEAQLVIVLTIENKHASAKREYQTWRDDSFSFTSDAAALTDNFGNRYRRVNFGLGTYPVGSVKQSESIYPGKSITDVLIFQPPVDNAEHLRLELPAANFGGSGMLRLQIPKSMIK